jgi:aldehyde:ferredoxin oxidoreductase
VALLRISTVNPLPSNIIHWLLGHVNWVSVVEDGTPFLEEAIKDEAQETGPGSDRWAVKAKGLQQSRVETRSAKGYALAFPVNPRDSDNLHAQPIAEMGFRLALIALIQRIAGSGHYANPYVSEKKAEIVVWHEECYAAGGSSSICSFPITTDFAFGPPPLLAELLSAATGTEVTEPELMWAGRRIRTMEKCFNVREGTTRDHNRLPWRLMHEESPDRTGAINAAEETDRMLDAYYALRGWDLRASWPSRETLVSLGLSAVADRLGRIGRVP